MRTLALVAVAALSAAAGCLSSDDSTAARCGPDPSIVSAEASGFAEYTLVVPVPRCDADGNLISPHSMVVGLDSDPRTMPQDMTVLLPMESGTVRAVRMLVQDGGGTTRVAMELTASSRGGLASVIAASPMSIGSGHEETIAIMSLSIVVAPGVDLSVRAFNASGIFASFVYRIEVDFDRERP